jgi:carbamoyl-phosphate synthase small subunit
MTLDPRWQNQLQRAVKHFWTTRSSQSENQGTRSGQKDAVRTHTNLNDDTLAGLKHKTDPMFSVQYHPEASPGPHDSHYLFRDFRKMMEEWKK